MMNPRFERRREHLLKDAKVKPQVYLEALKRLPEFLEPYLKSLGRREQKVHLREYMDGLLSDAKRKNVETIAYLHDQDRKQLQRFIGESNWDYKPMLNELTSQVGQALGEADGVIVFDPSGFEKDGKKSLGVQRQWLGRLGKVDHGQVGIYLEESKGSGVVVCPKQRLLTPFVPVGLPEPWQEPTQSANGRCAPGHGI